MKMGDGVTPWNSLPYAIPDALTPSDIITTGFNVNAKKYLVPDIVKEIR